MKENKASARSCDAVLFNQSCQAGDTYGRREENQRERIKKRLGEDGSQR